MNQLSLFSDPAEPVWRPDPNRVRARLARILAEARDPGPEAVRERLRGWLPEYAPPESSVSRSGSSA